MKYDGTQYDQRKTHLPQIVLQYVCENVLPLLVNKQSAKGFTEHNRFDGHTNIIFRCNPSYRSDSGQLNSVWYDYCLMNIDGTETPCQLLCFLDLILDDDVSTCGDIQLDGDGIYAVARKFETTPTAIDGTSCKLVKKCTLSEDLILVHTETITSVLSVVPDPDIGRGNNDCTKDFLVVSNRTEWLDQFRNTNRKYGNTTQASLYEKSSSVLLADKERRIALQANRIRKQRQSLDNQEARQQRQRRR